MKQYQTPLALNRYDKNILMSTILHRVYARLFHHRIDPRQSLLTTTDHKTLIDLFNKKKNTINTMLRLTFVLKKK